MAHNVIAVCYRRFFSRLLQNRRHLTTVEKEVMKRLVAGPGQTAVRKFGMATVAFAFAMPFMPTVNAAMWGGGSKAKVEEISEDEKVLKQADDLYEQNKFVEVYELLVEHRNSTNDEILWRLARAACDMGKNATRSRYTEYMLEAFGYIQKALEINDNNFAVHKWYAILLDIVKGFEGTRARIETAYECKNHLERAVELNPNDATTIHSIGYWCFLFADMPWYQRKIAAAIYATPPTSTYEEALKFFKEAEMVSPNFYSMNLLYLAKCYYALGDKEQALHFATKTREYYMKTSDDLQAHTEACQLLKKLGVKLEEKK